MRALGEQNLVVDPNHCRHGDCNIVEIAKPARPAADGLVALEVQRGGSTNGAVAKGSEISVHGQPRREPRHFSIPEKPPQATDVACARGIRY